MFEAPKHEKPPETHDASNFASRPEMGGGGFENGGGESPDDIDLSKHEMPGGFREVPSNPEPPDDIDLSKSEMPGGFRDEGGTPAGAESSANEPQEQPSPQAQESRDTDG